MSKFELIDYSAVKGRIKFKKLVIDGECQYDTFCNQIRQDGNLTKQLIGIVNSMDRVANLIRLSNDKFKDITPDKQVIKEFEFKKGDLRVYAIKEEGHIIIMGGKKGKQREDIRLFRSIKQRYLESKKQKL